MAGNNINFTNIVPVSQYPEEAHPLQSAAFSDLSLQSVDVLKV